MVRFLQACLCNNPTTCISFWCYLLFVNLKTNLAEQPIKPSISWSFGIHGFLLRAVRTAATHRNMPPALLFCEFFLLDSVCRQFMSILIFTLEKLYYLVHNFGWILWRRRNVYGSRANMLNGVMAPGRARVIYCEGDNFKECPYEDLPENLELPGLNESTSLALVPRNMK